MARVDEGMSGSTVIRSQLQKNMENAGNVDGQMAASILRNAKQRLQNAGIDPKQLQDKINKAISETGKAVNDVVSEADKMADELLEEKVNKGDAEVDSSTGEVKEAAKFLGMNKRNVANGVFFLSGIALTVVLFQMFKPKK